MERRRETLEAERAEKWEEREWAKRERDALRLRLQAAEQERESEEEVVQARFVELCKQLEAHLVKAVNEGNISWPAVQAYEGARAKLEEQLDKLADRGCPVPESGCKSRARVAELIAQMKHKLSVQADTTATNVEQPPQDAVRAPPSGRVSFVVDGETYIWPRLPLYDYGDENRRQMDAIRARIKAECNSRPPKATRWPSSFSLNSSSRR